MQIMARIGEIDLGRDVQNKEIILENYIDIEFILIHYHHPKHHLLIFVTKYIFHLYER